MFPTLTPVLFHRFGSFLTDRPSQRLQHRPVPASPSCRSPGSERRGCTAADTHLHTRCSSPPAWLHKDNLTLKSPDETPASRGSRRRFSRGLGKSSSESRSSPLQSQLRLLLLVLDDLTDGLSGRDHVVFDAQVWVKVQQVLVLLGGRELVAVLRL